MQILFEKIMSKRTYLYSFVKVHYNRSKNIALCKPLTMYVACIFTVEVCISVIVDINSIFSSVYCRYLSKNLSVCAFYDLIHFYTPSHIINQRSKARFLSSEMIHYTNMFTNWLDHYYFIHTIRFEKVISLFHIVCPFYKNMRTAHWGHIRRININSK